ncbi:MAG: ComEC family competence protein [Mesorhizobium sp.]|uniref:ComEC/Rec2 family competence protein n=1 Tax=Mesorhizobium sp. TaxID=1871066 RepID=UPI000FE9C468|nr:ComEC/Rec2 family competence protein [Mesorhizobium sp.]RWI10627.1 MAG: ComEC family competence protein [Mesorhizobium sp.]RWM87296.1 MAG: ComEC family competence protein [Mesorhizobium sp.]TIO16335.1 MAG: ComEC family competence protein [Mesorhizobium sp.]TJW55976.1 MAG: ComEC family competence protein [Mesorhizobium sp.]
MAGPGRGADKSEGATTSVSERSLFADVPHAEPLPVSLPASQPGIPPLSPDRAAPTPAPTPGPVIRFRRQLSQLSPSGIRNSVASAAGLELDRGVAFLLVPVFLACGVILYFSLAVEPDFPQPIAVVVLTALGAAVTRSWHKTHLCLMAALLCALGVLAAKLETWRVGTQMLGSEIQTQLTGRVVRLDQMANGRIRLTIDVMSTARPTLRYAPERVRVSARKIPAEMTSGSVATGYVRLLPPTGPVRPDSYDFSFDSYFAGIGASGFFLGNPKIVVSEDAPFAARLSSSIEKARETIADHIRDSIGGAEGEIAAALIVGVRAGIPEEINESMRRTGIYHIISISGLHMALVAGTIMGLLRGVFALFPDFSSRRPVKKYAAAAALLSITAYLIFSGIVVAAERSFIMLAVMLIAVLFDRAALTMRNLTISAIAVIVVSPHEVVGPSFQMSFAATAALVGAYAGWSDYRADKATAPPQRRSTIAFVSRKLAAGTGTIAMTSIIAGSATALFAIWHFQRVSPLSLFANLAVMPIVTVVMFLAVVSALAMPFGFDGPFLYMMGKGLTAMIAISGWISERSPVDAVGLISLQSVLLVTVALVIATMATTWLRLAALPFALAGLLTISETRTPDVLISEDAHLVALPIGGGELAVNRVRSNEFTTDNWKHALVSATIVEPETFEKGDVRFDIADPADLPPGAPFYCTAGLCLARHPSGAIIALADDRKTARPACASADLIVIDDATAYYNPCHNPLVLVVTKRQLARMGSAAVFFDPLSATTRAEIRFAVRQPYRPWHEQRRFSREARGLPPYRRAENPKKPAVQ